MKILVVYNPVAGKKKKTKKLIRKVLASADYDWLETNFSGDYLVGVDGGKYNKVIVAGGDGTAHEVANCVLKNNYDLSLAIVPIGSANLLAAAFKIPHHVGLATELALRGNLETIDVALVNKKNYFLIAAGLGYDAWVIKSTKRAWKRLFGFWAYSLAMIQGLFNLRETNFDLLIDGERHQYHAKTVFIMNFGKFLGFEFGPDISYSDGYLSLAVVRPITPADYFKMFGRLLGKKFHWEKRLEYFRFKKLQINYNAKIPVQLDGEEWEVGSPLEIEVLPGKLKIISKA